MDTEPQRVNVLAPNEAVGVVGVEIHIAEAVGKMNIALPSVFKMMRQKFERQWSVRKTQASEAEQCRWLGLLREASLSLEAQSGRVGTLRRKPPFAFRRARGDFRSARQQPGLAARQTEESSITAKS